MAYLVTEPSENRIKLVISNRAMQISVANQLIVARAMHQTVAVLSELWLKHAVGIKGYQT